MFALVLGASFTGTVLKWDQEGFEALAHNLEIGELLGGAGFWFSGEFAGGVPLRVRLYVDHGAIIPGLILALFAVHAMLSKRQAISTKQAAAEPAGRSEEHTSELQSIMSISYAVFCLKKKKKNQ